MVISWLPGVYLLLEGRELYRRKLEDSGMTLLAVANGDSEDEAIGRYVQREMLDMPQLEIEPASASPRAPLLQSTPSSSLSPPSPSSSAQSVGTLGLFSAGDS